MGGIYQLSERGFCTVVNASASFSGSLAAIRVRNAESEGLHHWMLVQD